MFDAVSEFISIQQGDSAEFIEKARAIAIGVVQEYKPARLYVIRIDNWFGPRWMHLRESSLLENTPLSAFTRRACTYHRLFRIAYWRNGSLQGQILKDVIPAAQLHIEIPSKIALKDELRTSTKMRHSYGSAESPRHRSGVR